MSNYRQVFYSGRVQGVGFRYTVKQIAAGYELVGWVRNLPDGRVELQVGGEGKETDGVLPDVGKSHLAIHIKQITQDVIAGPPTPWKGFEVRH